MPEKFESELNTASLMKFLTVMCENKCRILAELWVGLMTSLECQILPESKCVLYRDFCNSGNAKHADDTES